MTTQDKNRILVVALTVFVVFFIIVGIFSGTNKNNNGSQEKNPQKTQATESEKKATAYVCAKFQVLEELKAPSTAEFQSYPDALVYKSGAYYVVESYVDAQNSFGAMIRTNFKCKALNPNHDTGYCQSVSCAY